MLLNSLGYLGIHATSLDEWLSFADLIGLQQADRSNGSMTLRMDERVQRLVILDDSTDGLAFSGWEVNGPVELDALASRLDRAGVPVRRLTSDLTQLRAVAEAICFSDPAGNQIEVFYGAGLAPTAFRPLMRKNESFKTGGLGMGHIVLMVERLDDVLPFYTNLLGFTTSDFMYTPFKAHFLHTNARHHSLALVEGGRNGQLHHLMLELMHLDSVGRTYDMARQEDERVAVTLGRHSNDLMTSFYMNSPSKFLVEYGWGGLCIDPKQWEPYEMQLGPSLWGHDRSWMSPEAKAQVASMQATAAAQKGPTPVQVTAGNYRVSPKF